MLDIFSPKTEILKCIFGVHSMESGVINTKPRNKFFVVVEGLNVNLARVRMREGDIFVNTFLSKQFYSWNVLTEKNGGER